MKSIRNRFLYLDFIHTTTRVLPDLPGGWDQQVEGAGEHCRSLELRASIHLSSVEVSLAQRTGGDVKYHDYFYK